MWYFLWNYALICWFFGLILCTVGGILVLMFYYADHVSKTYGPTKQQRKTIRNLWFVIIAGLFAPLTAVLVVLALPFVACYGLFVACYGLHKAMVPIKRSFKDAFGREAVDE